MAENYPPTWGQRPSMSPGSRDGSSTGWGSLGRSARLRERKANEAVGKMVPVGAWTSLSHQPERDSAGCSAGTRFHQKFGMVGTAWVKSEECWKFPLSRQAGSQVPVAAGAARPTIVSCLVLTWRRHHWSARRCGTKQSMVGTLRKGIMQSYRPPESGTQQRAAA